MPRVAKPLANSSRTGGKAPRADQSLGWVGGCWPSSGCDFCGGRAEKRLQSWPCSRVDRDGAQAEGPQGGPWVQACPWCAPVAPGAHPIPQFASYLEPFLGYFQGVCRGPGYRDRPHSMICLLVDMNGASSCLGARKNSNGIQLEQWLAR